MNSWWTRVDASGATLEPREVPVPEPKAGELRFRVRAASLNRGEFLRSPAYGAEGDARPAGADSSGEVDAIGEGVKGWKLGDRVMGPARGAYAEYAIIDHRLASHAPERLSWEEAAAVPIVFQVTYDMLWLGGRLQPGEWLLVTGISSGVGVACLQAAKFIGAKVIGTSGSRAKLARLAALGLDAGIQTRSADFSGAVIEASGGQGANLVVNNVGGSVFAECVKSMAYQGRLATVGYLDRTFRAEIDLNALHSKRLHLFGVSARLRPVADRVENLRGFQRDLLPAFADGRIRPVIDKIFSLGELPEAKAYMQADAQVGKIVVRV